MKKIPSLFERDFSNGGTAYDEVTPGCEWVIYGDGVPTVKIDGTAVLVKEGRLYRRYDCKEGKTPPSDWEPCEPAPDPVTGHWPGWVPVGEGPEDRWFREAWSSALNPHDGTYECVGPKIGTAYRHLTKHQLLCHGTPVYDGYNEEPELNFEGIRDFLARHHIEGIVWHHEDGRMVKVKRKDFGLEWPGEGAFG